MKTFLTFVILCVLCASSIFAKDVMLNGSRPAMATRIVRPKYPQIAMDRRITGCGVVRMKINPAGLVEKVEMAQSTGSPILDKAVLDAFRQWRFKPGSVIGYARAPVCFTMSGTEYFVFPMVNPNLS